MKHASTTIYGRFRQRALASPWSTCVVTAEGSMTFAEIDMLACKVALRLGDMRGRRAGIVMGHGPMQVGAMLGVLKAGGSYVPAEPSLPARRRRYMMESAKVTTVITDRWMRAAAASHDPANGPQNLSIPDGEAYVLFTSGTSGLPKGVRVANSSVVNYAEAFRRETDIAPGDVMLQYSVCSFDIFVEEVFATLLNGAAIAVPPASLVASDDMNALVDFCAATNVSFISGFPYLLAALDKIDRVPPRLRVLISGGDVLRASYIERLRRRHGLRIFNTYGPSETTVCATYCRVDNIEPLPDGTYPIGHVLHGVEVRLLDADLRPAAPGARGELCILGAGVALGYLGDPEESRNFVTLPDGTRMYRSGDLGYMLPGGDFGFLHRIDDQVMILGRRVEPAEVENVLNASPEVERGVVRSFVDERGLPYLVAYFVPRRVKEGGAAVLRHVRGWLGERLADFMVPSRLIPLRSIPLTRRGKVDTSALPKVSPGPDDDKTLP